MQENQIQEDEIDIKELILTLIKGWKIIVITGAVITMITLVYAITLPNQYKVVTQAASIGSSGGQMAGLAALAGMSVPTGGSDVNLLDYVEEVVKNGDFLDRLLYYPQDTLVLIDSTDSLADTVKTPQKLVERDWKLSANSEIGSSILSDYFEIEIDTTIYQGKEYDFRLRRALYQQLRRKKKKVLSISFNEGVLEVVTKFKDPQLSFDFHELVLINLRDYFQNDYTIKDKEKRVFIQERVDEVSDLLRLSENRLTRYLNIYPSLVQPEEQRTGYVSPKVLMEYGRRKRVVQQHSSIYIELLKQLETAKIDEKKEQPVFEVVRKSELPIKASEPKRKLVLIVGMILGGAFGTFLVFAKEWVKSFKEEK